MKSTHECLSQNILKPFHVAERQSFNICKSSTVVRTCKLWTEIAEFCSNLGKRVRRRQEGKTVACEDETLDSIFSSNMHWL